MSDGKPTVLLVEDSAADREIIRRALGSNGENVELNAFYDGESALGYLTEHGEDAADLILLDLNLPDIPGREILQRIRTNPQLKHIPVIVLTTSQARHEILECYRLGANCFLTKPSAFASFAEMLQLTCRYWFHLATLPRRDPATLS